MAGAHSLKIILVRGQQLRRVLDLGNLVHIQTKSGECWDDE